MRNPVRFNVFFFTLFILSFCNFTAAPAQDRDLRSRPTDKQDYRQPLRATQNDQQVEQQLSQFTALDISPQALEAPIDPTTYIVGPGDRFQIGIRAGLETSVVAAVSPEGRLTIPTIGTLTVAEKTLQDVRNLIKQRAAKKYIGAPVTVNLVGLRSFRVHVTGQVMKPAIYQALAVDRVSALIDRAGGLTSWGAESRIEIRHLDGTTDTVDLYRYRKLGDLEANSLVRAGDVVYVPFINFQNATVRVEGLVNDPGIYQLVENETIEEFLLRVDALNRRADLEHARLRRQKADSNAYETIAVFPHLSGSSNGKSNFYLQDGDVIFIPKRDEDVYVVGAVRNPGPYPFYPNYSAVDYVGLAGSTERATKLSKIKLLRQGTTKTIDGNNVEIRPGDTILIPEKVTFGVREVLLITGQITTILLTLNALNVFN